MSNGKWGPLAQVVIRGCVGHWPYWNHLFEGPPAVGKRVGHAPPGLWGEASWVGVGIPAAQPPPQPARLGQSSYCCCSFAGSNLLSVHVHFLFLSLFRL
ncbi:Uncharacterized protein TCM_012051 [Theobroma cacao]|uniref:Uncharacterized protein n=1 Tax=Theobroma cacao TaxID=3641 RepID=A0A061G108_THECC|nr:Uncharacterized protein TCM_012051 [Theobroma cacao]